MVPSVAEKLTRELFASKQEYPVGSNSYFIPINDIEELVTRNAVRTAVHGIYPKLDERHLDIAANHFYTKAQKVFVMLFYRSNRAYRDAILGFIEDHVTDGDLPLARVRSSTMFNPRGRPIYTLGKKNHNNLGISSLSSWRASDIEDLCRDQWAVLAPIFRSHLDFVEHLVLDSSIVLPYIEDQETDRKKVKRGGYSEVWGVKIHPAHQYLLSSKDRSVRQASWEQRKKLTNFRAQ